MHDNNDFKRYIHRLTEIAELAEHISLVGDLHEGIPNLVRRYNQVVTKLEESGVIDSGDFTILAESAKASELLVEARMLRGELKGISRTTRREGDQEPTDFSFGTLIALAPFTNGDDLAKLVQRFMDSGRVVPTGELVALAPFLRGEVLSELIERSMAAPKPPVAPEPPKPPKLHEEPSTEILVRQEEAIETEGRDLFEILADDSISAEDRLRLAKAAIRDR